MTMVLMLMLLATLLFVGRAQSEKIVVTLLLNGVILLCAMVLMLMGFHAVFVGWLCILGTSILTLFYQNGFNQKTAAAFLALLIVVVLMSFLIWFVCVRAGLYGLDERNWEEDDVVMLDLHLHINMIRVTYVVIALGLLGAAKDSAMAVATGAYEVFRCHPEMSWQEVYHSGMNIGRDILGVTINTLLFAVIGQSLLMIEMYFDCGYPFSQLINSKSLFQSAMVVLTGGIGVELSIPVTALVLSALCAGKLRLPAWTSFFCHL
ncbi:hypothetical protein OBV_05990 [Oscillibacter valericigenes Sjm18-20]|nr:hypothetical protein OBV_05990 [Oscillibacter valericigenes Sjm18-20]